MTQWPLVGFEAGWAQGFLETSQLTGHVITSMLIKLSKTSVSSSVKRDRQPIGFWEDSIKCLGFPGGASGKELACQGRRQMRHWFDPWVGKILWRREWQPTPVFLPGESHGQRSLVRKSWTWLKWHHTHTHNKMLRQVPGGHSPLTKWWLLSESCCFSTVLQEGRCSPHLRTLKEAGNLAGYILIVFPLKHVTF